jgi:hypothetical protein
LEKPVSAATYVPRIRSEITTVSLIVSSDRNFDDGERYLRSSYALLEELCFADNQWLHLSHFEVIDLEALQERKEDDELNECT